VSADLEGQVRDYSEHLAGLSDPISLDEITSPVVIVPSRETGADSSGQTRGRGWVWLVAVAASVVLFVGLIPMLAQTDRDSGSAGTPSDLGVFEPLRGRIVVVHDSQLEAIDPADPTSPNVIDIPDLPPVPDEACSDWSSGPCDDGAGSLMPVGWSSDGTVLALESEHTGMTYLMDSSGSTTRVPLGGGCCWFVDANWLSPDGQTRAGQEIVDLRDMSVEAEIELDPDRFPGVEGWGRFYVPTWSPDGAEFAFVIASYDDQTRSWNHTIHIYNRGERAFRQLEGPAFGHVRNLAWSPDGTQLLVIAGDLVLPLDEMHNPLASPLATSIYLVDISSGESQVIADGHYVAAAWSPEGGRIAAVDYPNPNAHYLVVMNADGTGQRTLTDMTGYGYKEVFTGITWHPTP
jgi:WD40 repeat protein